MGASTERVGRASGATGYRIRRGPGGLPQEVVADNGQVLRRPQHTDRRTGVARCGSGHKRLPLLRLPPLRGAGPATRRPRWAPDDARKYRAADGTWGGDAFCQRPPKHQPNAAECDRKRDCKRDCKRDRKRSRERQLFPVDARSNLGLLLARIHSSAWKSNSPKFATASNAQATEK